MRFSIPGSSVSSRAEPDFVYYGTLFGTFLMVQKNGVFYLIDQHAAHERILFNKLMAGGSETQELLVPYEIQTDSKEDDDYLSSIQATLSTAGFKCENKGNGKWIFKSLPARYTEENEDYSRLYSLHNNHFGICATAGYEFPIGIQINLHYKVSLSDIAGFYSEMKGQKIADALIYPQAISLGIGYRWK